MWTIAATNIGGASWASRESGLPSPKGIWHLVDPTPYGMWSDLCMTENAIYLNSAKRVVCAINLDDGGNLWQTALPDKGTWGVAIDKKYVFCAPYVLNRASGEVLFNVEETAMGVKQKKRSRPSLAGDHFIWSVGAPTDGLHCFYPGGSENLIPIALDDMQSWRDSTLVYGVNQGAVTCLDIDNGVVRWTVALPIAKNGAPMVCGHALINIDLRVYVHVNFDSLWCIEGKSGQFVWKTGPDQIERNAEPCDGGPPQSFLACDDRIYLGREIEDDGFLRCHDTSDGHLLWQVDARDARFGPIAGDLLFGVTENTPVAWDRYTGEIVWRSENRLMWTFFAAAAGNKIVYTTTTGMMRCYAWDTPYRSPGRPEQR